MNLNGRRLLAAILTGAGLFGTAITNHAQEDILVDKFDSDAEVALWSHWWGGPPYDFQFDPSMDANGDSSSGSMKIIVDFDLATYGGDNQYSFLRDFKSDPDGFKSVDGTKYTRLVMHIKFYPYSPTTAAGDYGFFEYGIRKQDYSQDYFGNVRVSSTETGWVHLEAPVPIAHAGIESIAGMTFKMWSGDTTAGFTGTSTFWVDNIKLIASTNSEPPPPPSLSIAKADPGLHLYASADGAQYQRQNIRTISPEYSWVDAGQPVTYSFDVKEFPGTNYAGFQMHMFLVPGAPPSSTTAPDWNEPDVIFFQLGNNSDGTGTATFHYKVDQANGNSMYWNSDATAGPVGSLASISDPKLTGRWSLTFSNNTDVTITTPSGSSTNFVFPADAVAKFANPLYVYFGDQPNTLANIGQGVTLSHVAISGAGTPIDENFTGVIPNEGDPLQLDPNIWEIVADNKPGVVLTDPNASWTASWTVPATGFEIQTSPTLTSPSWAPIAATPVQVGTQKMVTLTSDMAQGKTAFFRLVKPEPQP
jgi:hypothetical protein